MTSRSATAYLSKVDPHHSVGWWRTQRERRRDGKLNLIPRYRRLFGSQTLTYFRPRYSPDDMGSTAQAMAHLATSPAARAVHL